MPMIDFDGEALQVPEPDDLSIALTEHELRTLLAMLPDGDALPLASRGELFVLMPGSHTLRYVVALARLRPCVDGGERAQTPENGAQMAQEPVPASTLEVHLDKLAEHLQGVVEGFMNQWEVDPRKFDHQNRAGELVARILGSLRRQDYLGDPEPVSVMDSPAGGRSLRQATRDGYLTQRDKVEKFVTGALEGRPLSTQRVMEALDEVLAR